MKPRLCQRNPAIHSVVSGNDLQGTAGCFVCSVMNPLQACAACTEKESCCRMAGKLLEDAHELSEYFCECETPHKFRGARYADGKVALSFDGFKTIQVGRPS